LASRVVAEMKDGGPSALLYLLQTMAVDRGMVRRNIKNAALAEMKDQIRDPVDAWWYERLQDGKLLPDYLRWAQDPEKGVWPQIVGCDALHFAMRKAVKERSPRADVPTIQPFLTKLRQLTNFEGLARHRLTRTFRGKPMPSDDDDAYKALPLDARSMDALQRVIPNLPSIEDCRKGFERHIGQKVEWPTLEDDKLGFLGTDRNSSTEDDGAPDY
jgi:hypothetical protein